MNEILLKIKNLKKHYQNGLIKALDGVNLNIYQGEVLSLLGVNGAGKTTLSSLLATLKPATSGEILFEGKNIYENINNFRENIGYCPQKPNLNFNLTVQQNIEFAGAYFGLDKKEIKIRTKKLIAEYQLGKYINSDPDDLSGGYKQRIVIARSLIHKPKLLILDEPTVGLDPHIRHQLWETIRSLKNEGVTVILTTHYIDEAEILSDRICVMDKGKIKLIDTPENLTAIYQKSRLEDVFLQLMHEEPEGK